MIHDLDHTLKALLEEELKDTFGDVRITFASCIDYYEEDDIPQVNLLLYDLQERKELRGNEEKISTDSNGITHHQPAPIWLNCLYGISAFVGEIALQFFPSNGGGEPLTVYTARHWLLTEVLKILVRHAKIPETFYRGSLAGADPAGEIFETETLYQPKSSQFMDFGYMQDAIINYKVTLAINVHKEVKSTLTIEIGEVYEKNRDLYSGMEGYEEAGPAGDNTQP